MPTAPARRGRPPGLAANPDAFADALEGRPLRWLADTAEMSISHLSEILSGKKGVTRPQAEVLASVLRRRPGTLFPQLVSFRVEARVFTVTGSEAA